MAAFYRKNGMSLIEAREKMYETYGHYFHGTQNIKFEGSAGMKTMMSIMDKLRKYPPKKLAEIPIVKLFDYSLRTIVDFRKLKETPKKIELPKSNVIKLILEDNSVVIVRPSGTEPKLKVYYTCVGATLMESAHMQDKIMREFSTVIGV